MFSFFDSGTHCISTLFAPACCSIIFTLFCRESGRQTLVRSKEQQRPVQRVPPADLFSVLRENNKTMSGPSEQTSEPVAKMILLQNGEKLLITLHYIPLPKESWTLQELLEQMNVPFTEGVTIQCMQNSSEIDYFVSVGSTTRIEEMLENHPILQMLAGGITNRNFPSVLAQPPNSEMSTPENVNNSPPSPKQRSPPPRYVKQSKASAVSKLCSRCERNNGRILKVLIAKMLLEDDTTDVSPPKRAKETPPQRNYFTALDLQGNNISIIFQSDFQNLKELKILQLSENQIHTIERDAFLELNSLERLKLSNNRLGHLPDGIFVRLRHLQRLNISSSKPLRLNWDKLPQSRLPSNSCSF